MGSAAVSQGVQKPRKDKIDYPCTMTVSVIPHHSQIIRAISPPKDIQSMAIGDSSSKDLEKV